MSEATLPGAPGFWSDKRIKSELAANSSIVSGYKPDKVESACYVLTVGEEVYISPSREKGDWSRRTKTHLKRIGEGCAIPPGQFAFILTEEALSIPKGVLALLTMKMAPKYQGLVNVSGFQVDPGFEGKLIFAVFNAGPSPIHVQRGDPWFALYFINLDQICETGRSESHPEPRTNIPTSIINSMASGNVYTFEGLKSDIEDYGRKYSERISALERDVAIVKWAALLILGAVIPLVIQYYKGH